jgi:hypothetical protein
MRDPTRLAGGRWFGYGAPMRFPTLILAASLLALAPLTLNAAPASKPAAKHATPAKSATPAEPAPKSLGSAKNWSAYATGSGKTAVCYIVGKPAKTLPEHVARGRIDAHVTHRPGENAVNVVNFELGYDAKPNSNADLTIDGKKFALFTAKQGAWASDAATDKAVTVALSKGKIAVLKATSAHAITTTDTYSLEGFSAMLALIDKACSVKR